MLRFYVDAPDPRAFPNGKPMIVCPVRFTRFRPDKGVTADRATNMTTGCPPVIEFGVMQPGPPTAHGPAVCFRAKAGASNDFKIQVVRDRVSADAKLFPVVVDPSVATIVVPAPGSYIPVGRSRLYDMDDDAITLRALPGPAKMTKLQLHHGALGGPVIAELTMVVLSVFQIPIRIHDVTIHGPSRNGRSPASSPERLKALFDDINVVFEQVGLEIFFEQEKGGLPKINAVQNQARRATYRAEDRVSRVDEIYDVLSLGNGPNVLNAYVVRNFAGAVGPLIGFGLPRSRAATLRATAPAGSPAATVQPGLVLLAEGAAAGPSNASLVAVARKLLVHMVAHEIGHALELTHFAGGEAATHNVRHDFEAHSNLMHSAADLPTDGVTPPGNAPHLYNSPMRAEIGYARSMHTAGPTPTTVRHAGQAITLTQMVIARVAAAARTYKQF